jgi:hypothetical protein
MVLAGTQDARLVVTADPQGFSLSGEEKLPRTPEVQTTGA